jgi:hypothetical protein
MPPQGNSAPPGMRVSPRLPPPQGIPPGMLIAQARQPPPAMPPSAMGQMPPAMPPPGAPMQRPPSPGMPPPGAPQMPPRPAMPPAAPPGQMPQAGGAPPPPSAPQAMPPGLAQLARGAQAPGGPAAIPGQQPQRDAAMRLNPAELARLGRNGDSVVAHLTPGEIEIPPEIQSPQLLTAIRKAFDRFGVSPSQFTAGSPASSQNPRTGMPEYSIWSAIVPAAAAIVSAYFAPELLPEEYAADYGAAASAAGAAIGGAAGSAAVGDSGQQSLINGLGYGAGTYLGGMLTGANDVTAANTAENAAATGAGNSLTTDAAATQGTNAFGASGWTDTTPSDFGPAVPVAGASGAAAAGNTTAANAATSALPSGASQAAATQNAGLIQSVQANALPQGNAPLGGAPAYQTVPVGPNGLNFVGAGGSNAPANLTNFDTNPAAAGTENAGSTGVSGTLTPAQAANTGYPTVKPEALPASYSDPYTTPGQFSGKSFLNYATSGAGKGLLLGGIGAGLIPTSTSTKTGTASLPAYFTNTLAPLNTNYNQLLGNNQPIGANFTGFNPVKAVSGQPYDFYTGSYYPTSTAS